MSTAQSRPESLLAMSLYRARNEEIKKYLGQLLEGYGEPKGTIQEVRAMMDRALSGEIHKIREDRFYMRVFYLETSALVKRYKAQYQG